MIRNEIVLFMGLMASLLFTSCGEDIQGDIDNLNDRHTSLDQRVKTLETQVTSINSQLAQLTVLATAVEQGFYVTQVKTTADGYELTLSNGRVIVLQSGPDNRLTPVPAVSMTQINGFFYWTLNGVLFTDGDGQPIRATGQTPVVKYDYTLQQWVVSVDGGVTFRNISEYISLVINDTVLLQVINSYVRQHTTTVISQEELYQIISTYIQRNYAELFNVRILDEVVVNYVNQRYTRIFSYDQMEKIFSQYNFEYYTSQIKVDELVNVILSFIRENQDIFVNNEVLYELISAYIEMNKTTIFSNELLLEVINNFIENNENFIDVELLTQVVYNYIDLHQDVVFNTEVIRNVLMEYVKKYYTQVFSQDILLQIINSYVISREQTIFNKTLIEEVVNTYLQNNFTTIISQQTITEIVNNYLKTNSTTVFNREVLVEVISNYFERNYNLFIDRTVISQTINTYIEQHQTTIISVDIVRQIIYNYLQENYLQVFSYDMLTQVVRNYFEQNMRVLTEYVSSNTDPIRNFRVVNDACVVTLSNGQTFSLTIYDEYARLRDRVQSIVLLPNADGRIDEPGNGILYLRYLVSPASMAQVIQQKYNSQEITLELKGVDEFGNISTLPVYEPFVSSTGVLNLSAMVSSSTTRATPPVYTLAGSVKAVALHVKETKAGGTDIMTEFTVIGSEEQKPQYYTECPDDNHPHMIDLGLPSGTLWACCNVGSTTPVDSDEYYAWGEIEAKSSFSMTNYNYGSRNIGSDIAGTDFDVACMKWGNTWRMPTRKQMQELIDYCEIHQDISVSTRAILVLHQGFRITGSNGGSIFLPAAGAFFNGNVCVGDGGACYYWSSTLDELHPDCAFNLDLFAQKEPAMYYGSRFYGMCVRPVASYTK